MTNSLSLGKKKKRQEKDHYNFSYVHGILIKTLYELTQTSTYKTKQKYILWEKS